MVGGIPLLFQTEERYIAGTYLTAKFRDHMRAQCSRAQNFTNRGSNISGQLGLGSEDNRVLLPQKVEKLSGVRVTKVICGTGHTAAFVDPSSMPPRFESNVKHRTRYGQ